MSSPLDAVHAELLKVGTLPAGWLSVLGIATLTVAAGTAEPDTPLAAAAYTQTGFLVLGAQAATSEYAGGQIRTTLLAVPRRVEAMAAQAVVLGLTGGVLAAAVVGAVVAFTPAAATGAAAATAYLALLTVLAAAVGALLRGPLPSLAGLLAWFLVVAPLARGRADWVGWLPDVPRAGDAVHGTAVLLGWTLVLLAVAVAVVHRRDA